MNSGLPTPTYTWKSSYMWVPGTSSRCSTTSRKTRRPTYSRGGCCWLRGLIATAFRSVRSAIESTGALSERTNGRAGVGPPCPCQAEGALVVALPARHRHRRPRTVRPLRETVRPLREMRVQPRPGCRRRLLWARPPQAPPVQARLSATGWPEPPTYPATPRCVGARDAACSGHRRRRGAPSHAGAVVVPGTTSGAYETPPLQP
jgi:hypothetical protein